MFVFFKRDAALHAKLAKVARSAKSHYLKLKELIMATQAETAQELRAITAQRRLASKSSPRSKCWKMLLLLPGIPRQKSPKPLRH